jgi:serine/threonine protein phosphatase 1
MVTGTLAPATIPAGIRIYAIGDVHGCDDRLAAMHAAVVTDLSEHPVAHPLLIHLGDYIDRGPNSAGVLDRLTRPIPGAPGLTVANLMGNHEDMLLRALASGDRADGQHWLANGGGETLVSWGLSWRDPPSAWAAGIPPAQLGLLRGLAIAHRVGGYIFVHAGLRPGVKLAAQTRHDMLWIREPFLSFNGELPAVAVHGHTPAHEPTVRPHRIGIDTGAVLGGHLTCAVLEGDRVDFLQT